MRSAWVRLMVCPTEQVIKGASTHPASVMPSLPSALHPSCSFLFGLKGSADSRSRTLIGINFVIRDPRELGSYEQPKLSISYQDFHINICISSHFGPIHEFQRCTTIEDDR